ncbi:MAG: dehydrogenase [Myxococcales bacterium]|nr:dehydrogenase [Myxococcales bacterium]
MVWLGVVALLSGCGSCAQQLSSSSEPETANNSVFSLEVITSEPRGVIWGMSFVDDDTILYTLRQGKMGLLDTGTGGITPVVGELPGVLSARQGGLLDVRAHPSFATNKTIYLSYSKPTDDGATTAVATARLDGSRLSDLQEIFVAEAHSSNTHHYGSRLQFDGAGHLFVTVGDRGERHKAQDLNVHNGKVLRLNEDGTPPEDNPFFEQGGPARFIWSYGHRNPQGLVFDAQTGELWEHEHGPRGGDELNLVKKGLNYGWPTISYGKEYSSGAQVGQGTEKEGMEQPVKYYVPSIAPCGMIRYSGDLFPQWRGRFFIGALAMQHINVVEIKDGEAVGEERLLTDQGERVRALAQSPSGAIVFSTDSGQIARLVPATNAP